MPGMRRSRQTSLQEVVERGIFGNLAYPQTGRAINVTADAGCDTGELVVKPLEQPL